LSRFNLLLRCLPRVTLFLVCAIASVGRGVVAASLIRCRLGSSFVPPPLIGRRLLPTTLSQILVLRCQRGQRHRHNEGKQQEETF
jgi:hypothetical protein